MSFFTLFILFYGVLCGPVPIIIDTDIGDDMDDSWAVALALLSYEVDVKMIITSAHDTHKRTQILAKFLDESGYGHIPIGIGIYKDNHIGPMYGWARDYDLSKYPGEIYQDGILAAFVLFFDLTLNRSNFIKNYTEKVWIVSLAPYSNLHSLEHVYPESLKNIGGVVGMGGSIRYCYNMVPPRCPEYNIYTDINAAQNVYTAPWDMTETPLDTSCQTQITGDLYKELIKHNTTSNRLLNKLLISYCYWAHNWENDWDCFKGSTILYDPTAMFMMTIYPNFKEHGIGMEDLKIRVSNQGNTEMDDSGKLVHEATTWIGTGLKDLEQWIFDRLTKDSGK